MKVIKLKSFRIKLMMIFVLLTVIISFAISSVLLSINSHRYYSTTNAYVQDVVNQVQYNLDNRVQTAYDLTFNILSDSVIQKNLSEINSRELSGFRLRTAIEDIEDEIEPMALYNENIISLSVFALDGTEIAIKKNSMEATLKGASTDEILKGRGSVIWQLVGEDKEICVNRAIVGMQSMEPIGYIKIVYKREWLDGVVKELSKIYSSGVYILNEQRKIMVTNRPEYLDTAFQYDIKELTGDVIYSQYDQANCYYYKSDTFKNGWTLVALVPLEAFREALRKIYIIVILATLFIIAGAVSIYPLISKRLSKPAETVLEVMKKFGSGDLKQRIHINSDDEIGQISQEYNVMAENIENLIDKVYVMELMQRDAEIEFLKMQINPHFLYNTLDTISWMGILNGNDDVAEVSIALAELLRSSVKNESFVTIHQEIKTVKNYLSIQSHRFGDRIDVNYDIDETVDGLRIPFFILQPIIENAIIHGLEPKVGKGRIEIRIKDQGEAIYFEVKDDGIGMTEATMEQLTKSFKDGSNRKIGIKNVYRRLNLYYGEGCAFTIESEASLGTAISFKIPRMEMREEKRGNDFDE